ncbi:helix-turn-helix transcriptional regulator [Ilumatobacter coccineus]|uniref:Putative ArsR family transcriptional regulator n=1 Tax=Ilumatobacter coccineus (strain NBRC 103263 / KCTC 29153 / YM16-304) TaxID=1313172 RepID=A0A6C7EGA1_ILUCY|nr:helix-turn-helix domain-containing protein [Ilumatobacter coccineus]BAN04159.1 putative ArsR family transcriptional regulator [Ilumatobacter coccineus YM16-304]
METLVPLDVLKALGDNTRYAIYLELARSSRPLATSDIAATLGLHANTVRPHLERMRDVGLLEVHVGGRGDVGRPQHRYAIAESAPLLGLEPPTTPVLAKMVLSMAKRLQASSDDAAAVGDEEGRRRARPYAEAPSTLEALVSDLDKLGFDPVVADAHPATQSATHADGPDDDGSAVIAFANCPFAELAREHPELVCGLHRGLIEGFVDEMGDATTRDFATLTSRTPCRVTVSAR